MITETGGPAFPVFHQNEITGYVPPESAGMTLRDYFAAKAMQTIISYRRTQFGTVSDEMDWDEYFPIIAQEAYALADAMLEARKA
jgi:hypothetical protein